jgi:DNA (cytosine-5)-methyltransferase 1
MLTTVDLFSGIGGFARGLEATGHFRTTCFVEQDPYCQAVLKHHWPDVPILDDIKNAKAFDFPDTRPDLVCGGFPCQPFSQAGRQRAQDDPRHLWPEMLRVIRELRPTWVVGENVVGLIKLGLDEVLTDLEGEGYATRTFNIPACATGAPHLRQRVWVVAHADSESEPDGNAGQRQLGFGFGGLQAPSHGANPNDHGSHRATEHEPDAQHGEAQLRDEQVREPGSVGQDVADPNRSGQCEQRGSEPVQEEQSASECTGEDVADAQRKREGRRGVSGPGQDKSEDGKGSSSQPRGHGEAGSEDHWISEPAVGRLVNGLPNRVSQLRALGNSIVPQIAQEIGQAIRIAHDVSKEN